jgi:hypothetical protein
MVTAGIFPFKESFHGRAGNRTRDLMLSSQRLWPLDHEANVASNIKWLPGHPVFLSPFETWSVLLSDTWWQLSIGPARTSSCPLNSLVLHSIYRPNVHCSWSSRINDTRFYPTDGGSLFLRRVGTHVPDRTISQPKPSGMNLHRSANALSHKFYLCVSLLCGGAVGWGTALQPGRSRVQFLMVSLEFFIHIIIPAALWPWGRLNL